jgi:acyl dehydratase
LSRTLYHCSAIATKTLGFATMSDTGALTVTALEASARLLEKGNIFGDFTVGQVFEHHWGRTLTQAENALFSTLTLHFNPLYFNADYARAHGHADTLLNPLLIFNTVFGLSVEDLSEAGMGPFLGVEALTHHRPVTAGATLTARSTVTAKRNTAKWPEFGIVTWHTAGFQSDGALVIDFQRSNLIRRER